MEDREKESSKELKLDLETFKSNAESTVELIREGFLQSGTRFGLGELAESPSMDMLSPQVDDVDAWVLADKDERKGFLRNVIIELGLVPDRLTRERAITAYEDPGIRGEPSEGGADVMVFKTQYPRLELHVLEYKNDDVGRRYDLVVTE